jgi:hypothetical protein
VEFVEMTEKPEEPKMNKAGEPSIFEQTVGPRGPQPADDMVPFEEKPYMDEDGIHVSKGIFVDGTLFDWGVDEEDYKQAVAMGPKYQKQIEASIAKHFVECFSEFLSRRITLEDVEEARRIGWIKKPKIWI